MTASQPQVVMGKAASPVCDHHDHKPRARAAAAVANLRSIGQGRDSLAHGHKAGRGHCDPHQRPPKLAVVQQCLGVLRKSGSKFSEETKLRNNQRDFAGTVTFSNEVRSLLGEEVDADGGNLRLGPSLTCRKD
ncbi:hypothetical protein NL676_002824 [Syzygium grande]|nr:hypothetical protein NL676_002824 [Syzygium grande]